MKARLIKAVALRRGDRPPPAKVLSGRARLKHQEKAFAYCTSVDHPALFLQMRLGKCKVIIDWVRSLRVRRALVVCPKPVIYTWNKELTTEGSRQIYRITPDTTFERAGWYITNYGQVIPRDLARVPWDVVVLDESTKIKNPQAKITKYCLKHFRNAPHRAILTGLPNPEGALNFVSQLLFLWGSFMGFKNYWAFRMRMCYLAGWSWELKPRHLEAFKAAVHSATLFMTKREAGLELPRVDSVRTVSPSASQVAFFKQMAGEWAAGLPNGHLLQTKWVVAKESFLAQAAGGFLKGQLLSDAKVREVVDLLGGELKGEAVLVWFRFLEELDATEAALLRAGINCRTLQGSIPPKVRDQNIKDFQDGKYPVFLIQEDTGLYGIDLSISSTSISYSSGYALEVRKQKEARIDSPIKKRTLLYISIVCEGSTDEDILEAQKEKEVDARLVCTRFLERMKERYGR